MSKKAPAGSNRIPGINPHITELDLKAEYYFEEGCHIIELANSAAEPELSIARARVEPGKTTRWHSLNETTERYVIIEGSGLVEIGDDQPYHVNVGDIVLIPPDVRQRIHNSGQTDLIFLALCTPRFEPENYRDCENTSQSS